MVTPDFLYTFSSFIVSLYFVGLGLGLGLSFVCKIKCLIVFRFYSFKGLLLMELLMELLIVADPFHPGLPLGRRLQSIWTKTSCHMNSFFHSAVRILNRSLEPNPHCH